MKTVQLLCLAVAINSIAKNSFSQTNQDSMVTPPVISIDSIPIGESITPVVWIPDSVYWTPWPPTPIIFPIFEWTFGIFTIVTSRDEEKVDFQRSGDICLGANGYYFEIRENKLSIAVEALEVQEVSIAISCNCEAPGDGYQRRQVFSTSYFIPKGFSRREINMSGFFKGTYTIRIQNKSTVAAGQVVS